jgi:hypothetical protein
MASGCTIDDKVVRMWKLFHKANTDYDAECQDLLKTKKGCPKDHESSDEDTDDSSGDEDCSPSAPKVRKPRCISFVISDDNKSIICDNPKFNLKMKKVNDPCDDTKRCLDKIMRRLQKGSSKSMKKPRYIVFFFDYQTKDGRVAGKELLLKWCPDNAGIRAKMVFASSLQGLCNSLEDFKCTPIQVDSIDEIADIVPCLCKGSIK